MNPRTLTEEQASAIRAQLAALEAPADATAAEAAALLNSPSLPNPVAAPQRLRTLDPIALFRLLGAGTVQKLEAAGLIPVLRSDIRAQDRGAVGGWIAYAVGMGHGTIDEAALVSEALEATEPDPAWPAEVSWAYVHLGREADAHDIRTARGEEDPE